MKALPNGTSVRVVNPDVLGEILYAETNREEFGYRVGWGAVTEVPDKEQIGKDPAEGLRDVTRRGREHERFFPAHEVENIEPLDAGVTASLSGTKDQAMAQIDGATSHPLLRDALKYLLSAMPGDRVSLTVSISTGSVSIGGSVWKGEGQ